MSAQALPVREALPGVDLVADARFMLAHPDVAHSPLHCRQIVAGLLDRIAKTEGGATADALPNDALISGASVPGATSDDNTANASKVDVSKVRNSRESAECVHALKGGAT